MINFFLVNVVMNVDIARQKALINGPHVCNLLLFEGLL